MIEKLKPCPNCHKDDAVVITQMHYGVSYNGAEVSEE
jgi:hypothetical protein